MKKSLILFACFLFFIASYSQYTLRIVVNDAASKDLDDWYIAGNFNNWNPKDEQYKLKPFGDKRKAIVLKNLTAGRYEYKFTRGGWDKVETTAKGGVIANREIELKEDTIAYCRIEGWSDDYPDKPRPNTATAQVKIIDTAFLIPQLNRHRRIWIYLPRGYATSKKSYPVLYMHDGQNLFNEQTAPFGEWGVDEALDTLQPQTKKECIVVGIDHGGDKRMTEYNPYDNDKYGKGEGDKYVEFLAKTLKPFIDKNYRTMKDSTHTFIAGSSMGGLISLYAVMKYPNVFGGAGIFSPAIWTAPPLFQELTNATWKSNPKFYFYAGGKESEYMVADMQKAVDIISKKKNYDTRVIVQPLGKHNEQAWRKEFPGFYNWIMR